MSDHWAGFKAVATPIDDANPWAGFRIVADPKPEMGLLESFGRGALEGGTMGFEDELGIADKGKQVSSKQANPWTHFAGEVAGGVASLAVPGAAAARLAKVGGTVANVARTALSPFVANKAATVGEAAIQGVKLGATYGAISGAGHAESGERLKGTGEGAVVGAAFGGVLGPAAYKIGEKLQIARAARNEMANADTASLAAIDRAFARDGINPSQLREQIQVPKYGKLTADEITEAAAMRQQGATTADIASRFNIGEEAVRRADGRFAAQNATPMSIVDRARITGNAGGENTAWTLRAGMSTPGKARAEAAEALTERQLTQAERIVDFVEKQVASGDPRARMETMKQAERTAYDSAYKAAAPFDTGPTAARHIQAQQGFDDDIARGVQRAAEPFAKPSGSFPAAAQLERFQRHKMAMDDAIEASKEGFKPTWLTRELMKLKSNLMDDVSSANPAWRQANDTFAENAAARRLFGEGQSMGFRLNATTRKELENVAELRRVANSRAPKHVKNAAKAQIEMYKDGLSQSIQNMVLNPSATGDHAARLLTPASRRIIGTVLGPDDSASLIALLEAEQSVTRTYRGLGGSQTTPLREAIDELNGPSMMASAWDMGNPRKILELLLEHGSRMRSESRNAKMVPMLIESDPIKQLAIMKNIETMRGARVSGGMTGIRGAVPTSNAAQDQARPTPGVSPMVRRY